MRLDLIACYRECSGLEMCAGLELPAFLPEHQVGFLQHILNPGHPRHQRDDIRPQRLLVAGDLTDKFGLLTGIETHTEEMHHYKLGKGCRDVFCNHIRLVEFNKINAETC